MFKCKNCQSTEEQKLFTPFSITRRQWAGDAKFGFHIKSICAKCKVFNKFLPQTQELMDLLKNNTLVDLSIIPETTNNNQLTIE